MATVRTPHPFEDYDEDGNWIGPTYISNEQNEAGSLELLSGEIRTQANSENSNGRNNTVGVGTGAGGVSDNNNIVASEILDVNVQRIVEHQAHQELEMLRDRIHTEIEKCMQALYAILSILGEMFRIMLQFNE